MKNLKEKLRKNGGFTLVEMLIVVAIIAILIAVSIPMVGSALERARRATDAANERAFKAELLICYLNDNALNADFDSTIAYGYDAANGKLIDTACEYGQSEGRKDHMLLGTVTEDGIVYMKWAKGYNKAEVKQNENLIGSSVDEANANAGGSNEDTQQNKG